MIACFAYFGPQLYWLAVSSVRRQGLRPTCLAGRVAIMLWLAIMGAKEQRLAQVAVPG
jgi:hypothetical protein